jgi:hypothetical protein
MFACARYLMLLFLGFFSSHSHLHFREQSGECVGDVLGRFVPMVRAAHRTPLEQHFVTVNGWRSSHGHAREIDALIRSAEKSCGETLSNLMLQPLLRISSYTVILEEMLVHTPPSHADRPALAAALVAFKVRPFVAPFSSRNILGHLLLILSSRLHLQIFLYFLFLFSSRNILGLHFAHLLLLFSSRNI